MNGAKTICVCVLLVAFAFPSLEATTWPCTFSSPDGYFYNLTSVNTNTTDKLG